MGTLQASSSHTVKKGLTTLETPPRPKATAKASYLFSSVETARKALIEEFGESIPELPVEFFLEKILPGLSQGLDVEEVIKKLKRRSPPEISNGRWSRFDDDPQSCRVHEDVVFKPLETLAGIISAESMVNGVQPLLVFQNNPNKPPESSMRNSTSRPDGYFVLRGRPKGKDRWADIALCTEYKKANTVSDRDDDVRKVIWSMHHCLREDPRRRFTFGMTIENTATRIWFCSRAELLVSQAFNFITDHRTLVRFFLAIMYAQPHEVGWDPTMKLVLNDKGEAQYDANGLPRFDILVQPKQGSPIVYRTIRLLSDIGANPIRGRGTRVWEAKRLEDGNECGNSVALKDMWIDDDRKREGDVLDELHKVPTDADERDHTRELMTRGAKPSGEKSFKLQHKAAARIGLIAFTKTISGKPSQTGIGDHRTPEEHVQTTPANSPTHHPKVHYRIIFEEVCQPIYALTSLSQVFNALVQMLYVLQVMHEHGWVHRDISTGNILVRQIEGKLLAKLSDLEYTKKIDEQGTKVHEVRTGTLDFMAIEADSVSYSFRSDSDDESPRVDPLIPLGSRLSRYLAQGPARPQAQPKIPEPVTDPAASFRYNPLHDLESIWWVAMYFVVNKDVVAVGDTPVKWEDQEQRQFAQTLFYTKAGRGKIMQEADYFAKNICLLHDSVKPIASHLQRLRKRLVHRYREIERDEVVNTMTAASGLHAIFSAVLEDIAGELRDNDIKVDTFRATDKTAHGGVTGAVNASEPIGQSTGKRRMEDAEDDLANQADGIYSEHSFISARPAARKKSKQSYPADGAGPGGTF